ncbi:MAG: glycogen-binding domain-containing protein [Gemmatimonadaceae bacterium]
MRNTIAVTALGLFISPSAGAAQSAVHFEAGGARVRYGDTVDVSAGTLSAGASALTRYASFSGLLAGSTTAQSSWTLFGAADGSVFTPSFFSLRGELHAAASGATYGSNTGSARVLGGGRLHLSGSRIGTWVGVSAGSVTDPIGARAIRQGEVGIWAQLGSAVAQVTAMPVRIAEVPNYTDTEGSVRYGSARFDLGATGGFRSKVAGYDESPNAWASVFLTAWLRPTIGITAAAGNYPADIGQDLPSARYVSLGLRVAPRRIIPAVPPLPSEILAASGQAGSREITVSRASNGNRTIRLRAPSAQSVEIMGDFTDWVPVQLTRAQPAGTWAITLPVGSGVQQINVRIDGGPWTVPSGLSAIRDEFGGSVGLLVVP